MARIFANIGYNKLHMLWDPIPLPIKQTEYK